MPLDGHLITEYLLLSTSKFMIPNSKGHTITDIRTVKLKLNLLLTAPKGATPVN